MADDIVFDPQTDLDITGLEWWEVLQRLHWSAKAMGPFAVVNHPLSNDHAKELIGLHVQQRGLRKGFESVNGRSMRISFHTKHGRSWVRGIDLYDQDAQTPARITISGLRKDLRQRRLERELRRPV